MIIHHLVIGIDFGILEIKRLMVFIKVISLTIRVKFKILGNAIVWIKLKSIKMKILMF